MAGKKNSEIMEAYLEGASKDIQKSFEGVNLADNKEVSRVLFDYKLIKNDFIESLVTKIYSSLVHSKLWRNKLDIFHGGMMEYGNTMEDIYVEASDGIDFKDHFGEEGSDVKDVIGSLVPKVYTNYLSRNFAKKYKITISDIQLRSAFTSETGLATLLNGMLEANLRGAYRDEYKLMKDMLFKYCKGLTSSDVGNGKDNVQTQYLQESQVIDLGETNVLKRLATSLRAMNDRLEFESDDFNTARVMQFSAMSDCVFVTTPEVKAHLDVQFFADLFNISKAEVKNRIVLIDELPKEIKTSADDQTKRLCVGMLMDKKLLRFKDSVFETRHFNNPNTLATNYFLHKQGLVGIVPFLNCIVYTVSDTVKDNLLEV